MDRKRDKSQSERGKEQRASDICSVIFVTVSSSKQHGNGSVQDRRQTPLCARSSVQKTCNTTGKTGQGARRIKRTKTTSKEPTTLKEPTKTNNQQNQLSETLRIRVSNFQESRRIGVFGSFVFCGSFSCFGSFVLFWFFGCVEFACFFRGLNYRKSPRFQLTGSRKIAGVHLLDA